MKTSTLVIIGVVVALGAWWYMKSKAPAQAAPTA